MVASELTQRCSSRSPATKTQPSRPLQKPTEEPTSSSGSAPANQQSTRHRGLRIRGPARGRTRSPSPQRIQETRADAADYILKQRHEAASVEKVIESTA